MQRRQEDHKEQKRDDFYGKEVSLENKMPEISRHGHGFFQGSPAAGVFKDKNHNHQEKKETQQNRRPPLTRTEFRLAAFSTLRIMTTKRNRTIIAPA